MTKKDWINRELDKGYLKEDVQSTLELFSAKQQGLPVDKRDIFQWDAKDLEEYLKTIVKSNEKLTDRGKYHKLCDTDRFLVVRVDDEAAAAFWGLGTKWCITQLNSNYYSNYRDSGNVFYYLIDKKAENQDKNSKFAICVSDKGEPTYYNAEDTSVSFDKLPESIKEFLKDDATAA